MGSDELVMRLRDYGDLTDSEVHSTRIEAADEIERLTAQLAEARESERAAVVAYARREHEAIRAFHSVVRNLDEFANAIEAGEHLK